MHIHLCIHTYVYVYTYMQLHACTFIHFMCIHIYIYVYTCIHIMYIWYVCKCIYIYTHLCVCNTSQSMCIYICIYIYIIVCALCLYISIHEYIYIYNCIYINVECLHINLLFSIDTGIQMVGIRCKHLLFMTFHIYPMTNLMKMLFHWLTWPFCWFPQVTQVWLPCLGRLHIQSWLTKCIFT